MITKEDLLTLLYDLKDNGVDSDTWIEKLVLGQNPTMDTVKFINDNRQMDLTKFYEKLRKSYNSGNSKLYKNIMNGMNEENPSDAISTLSSYALQVVLFGSSTNDKQLFYRFARLEEVYRCLYHYSKTFELTPCFSILHVLKADIKVMESCYRNNNEKK